MRKKVRKDIKIGRIRREEREREQEKAKVNIWRISNVEQREKETQELQKTDLKEVINKEKANYKGCLEDQISNKAMMRSNLSCGR